MKHVLLSVIVVTLVLSCVKVKVEKEAAADVDWARGIVWYQIFPERFYNAVPESDPVSAEVPDAENMPGWQVNSWTSDWYKLQPWELKKSDKFYDDIFTRRYGGDLVGVIQKLDYLKDLGIDAIYFNPVFEGASLHKYDGSSYHHIDDNFGPDSKGDKALIKAANETDDPATWVWTSADSSFIELIKEAHARNIKVVIDGVFNHTGTEFFAFKDIRENQQESIYKDWFEVTKWDDPNTPENEFDYNGWWGYKGLPVLSEDENGIIPGPREYIFASTRKWMDPNNDGDPSDGIDGWRLDVAEEVAMPFWVEWNALVKSINPKAITVAEIWHDASKYIENKAFDGTMNYPFARSAIAFFVNQKKTISGKEFANRLQKIEQTYGAFTNGLLWNLLDSHDTDRLASQILNPDRKYDNRTGPRDSVDYNINKPGPEARKVQKQLAAFQFTFSGAPMIYYGTEAGMWGGDDPDDRKPMLWEEFEYADETHHPIKGKTRNADLNKFDPQLYKFYKKLIAIRHQYSLFQFGTFEVQDALLTESIFAFKRKYNNDEALVLFNKADDNQLITINLDANYKDACTEEDVDSAADVKVNIPGNGFRILIRQ